MYVFSVEGAAFIAAWGGAPGSCRWKGDQRWQRDSFPDPTGQVLVQPIRQLIVNDRRYNRAGDW